jgi:copper(I)-binding protein
VPATVAAKAELHETASDAGAMGSGATGGGMLMMHSVASIAVPANGTTTLKPGGLHVMLLDLAAPLRNGDAVPVTFTFHEAGSITVQAAVRDS